MLLRDAWAQMPGSPSRDPPVHLPPMRPSSASPTHDQDDHLADLEFRSKNEG